MLDAWTNYECGCAGGPGDPDFCQECHPELLADDEEAVDPYEYAERNLRGE